jgi:hypothetical protein
VLNNTASQFAAHSGTVEAADLSLAVALQFMPRIKERIMTTGEGCEGSEGISIIIKPNIAY